MSRHLPQSLCRLQSRAHSADPPPKQLHLLHSNERGARGREGEKGGGRERGGGGAFPPHVPTQSNSYTKTTHEHNLCQGT